jgi:hypothetical protein
MRVTWHYNQTSQFDDVRLTLKFTRCIHDNKEELKFMNVAAILRVTIGQLMIEINIVIDSHNQLFIWNLIR